MNDFLKRISVAFENGAETGERIARQFDIDCFQIALARYKKRHFGFQVIMELSDLAEQVRAEYKLALQGDRRPMYTSTTWTRNYRRSSRETWI